MKHELKERCGQIEVVARCTRCGHSATMLRRIDETPLADSGWIGIWGRVLCPVCAERHEDWLDGKPDAFRRPSG